MHGAQRAGAAHAPAPADDPRMPGRRRHGPLEGGLVQPGLPRRPAQGRGVGTAARAARGGPRRARPSASPSTRSSAVRTRGWGATRPASCPSTRPRRDCRRAASASWRGSCAACSATRSSRCRRGCVPRPRLPAREDALSAAHWPELLDDVPPARRRLALEELFLFQLALVMRRRTRREVGEAEPVDAARRPRASAGSSPSRSS